MFSCAQTYMDKTFLSNAFHILSPFVYKPVVSSVELINYLKNKTVSIVEICP